MALRTEARIKTKIWDDEQFAAQEALAKLTYFTILSQSKLNLCGVISYTPKAWSVDIGISKAAVHKASLSLQADDFIDLDLNTEELWVRTLTKSDGVLKKPYMVMAMTKDFVEIKSRCLRGRFLDSLGAGFIASLPDLFPDATKKDNWHLSEGFVGAFHDWFGR